MTIPAPELSPGAVLDGHTIGAKVRMRSGAATFEATDPNGVQVHVTVYAAGCFNSTLVRERSLRELRQLQKVEAPQIARVLGSGKLDDGGIFEVNEPVVGNPLSEAGQMSRPEVGASLDAVGKGLLAAQKAGVIHRNLGANVIFSTPAGIKLLGFAVGEPQGGTASGSIDSIAPEQVNGKVVDQRTLIYNLAAIAHQLLTGAPLFQGSVEEKLDLHANREAPGAEAMFKRALSKDARMRPMMLKQFLGEFAKLGGGGAAATPKPAAPAGGAKPSTRGWTMFMEAQEAGGSPAPASPSSTPSPSTPAAAPLPSAPAPAPAPSTPAPAPAPAASKPSTRGWTMFMEAEDASAAPASPAAAPTPGGVAPSAPAPSPAPASPAPAPASPAPAAGKPSTRGWTMFMEAEEGAPASPAAAQPAAPAQAAPAPAPSQPAAPAPSQPAAPSKPSTRGWTMFMEAETGAEASPGPAAPAPSPAPTEAVAPAQPAAQPEPQPAAPAQPAGPSNAPSTRGWTMFMEAEVPGDSAPEQPAEPEAPAEPEKPAAQIGASDSKGWTVFMEKQPAGPDPEELAVTTEHSAQPAAELGPEHRPTEQMPVQPPADPPAPEVPAPDQTLPDDGPEQPASVPKQTVIMGEAPQIPAPGEAAAAGGSDVAVASVPATPAIEKQPAPAAPAVATPTSIEPAKQGLGLGTILGIVAVAVIIILVVVFVVLP